jgi:hypothetical protein
MLAVAVSSSTYSIGVGDGVLRGTGAQTVSAATWAAEQFARKRAGKDFVGIAAEGSPADESRDVTIHEAGVFDMPCTSCTPSVDDLFGWEKDAGGNYLDSDKLQLVIDASEAVFRCVEDYGAATTTVRVALLPRKAVNVRFAEHWWDQLSHPGSCHLSSGTAMISNWTFGRPVELLEGWVMGVGGDLSSDYGILFLKNGSPIMTSASYAAGAIVNVYASADFKLESSAANVFGPDDSLTIRGNGVAGAQAATQFTVGVRFNDYG